MAANLTARQLRVYIGSDDQEWSFAAADFLPEQESFGESGLVKTFASITLLSVLSAPESLDPRANPARWREGNTVRVDVATDTGGWFTWGTLRLLEIPSGPTTDGRLTLQLGCWLAWADDPQPEGDRSEVTTGIGENSATVATRLLVASGIPESAIDLGGWDYDLPYALQKEGNGSYIAQAGALAFANHCRQLYQDPSGIIRVGQWDAIAGEPVAIVTVGLNESLFVPNPDPVPPVERIVVSGVGYQPSTTPNRYSSRKSAQVPTSNYIDGGIGTVPVTTVSISTLSSSSRTIRKEDRLTEPRAATWLGSDSLSPTTAITFDERRYSLSDGRLQSSESGERASNRTLVTPPFLEDQIDLSKTVTEYFYNAAEVLVKKVETTKEPRILFGESIDPFGLIDTRTVETRWIEERPDYWVQYIEERIVAARASNARGKLKPTALVSQPPVVALNSRPPATDRWEDPTSLKEQHYSATCTWQHPGGATGRVRTRSLTLAPGFSNEQCFDVATREVQLLEGRRESHLIELPLSDAVLWLPPLSTIQVDDGANLWTFKLDATTWEYGLNEARLVAMGICVARVPVAVPVGVVLPEFASGLEPGQVAPEEPAPFVPPADEVRDVAVALSAAPASISAAATAKQTAIASLSAAPASLSAETVATQAANVALSAAPASLAAEVELRGAVSVALSAAPAAISAEAVATPAVAVALSAAPAAISAETVASIAPEILWLEADYAVTESSGAVSAGGDRSSNGYSFTQISSGARPTLITGTLNGKPVVRFDGSDFLNMATTLLNTTGATADIYVVADHRGGTTGVILSTRQNNNDGGFTFRYNSATQVIYFHPGRSPVLSQTITDQYNLLEIDRNGLSIALGVGGALGSSSTLSGYTASSVGTSIGSEETSPSLNGDIAAIIIATSNRSGILSYLQSKYGV